jgi:REP element-mobilizing transposase RayT
MPRQPRFVLVGHPQHVIIRGNNREPIFYADEDYRFKKINRKSIGSDSKSIGSDSIEKGFL